MNNLSVQFVIILKAALFPVNLFYFKNLGFLNVSQLFGGAVVFLSILGSYGSDHIVSGVLTAWLTLFLTFSLFFGRLGLAQVWKKGSAAYPFFALFFFLVALSPGIYSFFTGAQSFSVINLADTGAIELSLINYAFHCVSLFIWLIFTFWVFYVDKIST